MSTQVSTAVSAGGPPPGAAVPSGSGVPRVRRQRRRPLLLAGVGLALMGAVATAGLVSRAGHRVAVLALAKDVPVGTVLTSSDLRVAQVAADPALNPVPASRRAGVVGQVAAVDLRAGTLLTGSEVARQASATAGKQVIGLKVPRGSMPAGTLRPGDRVLAVPLPAAGSASGGSESGGSAGGGSGQDVPSPVDAVVLGVGDPAADGSVVVTVAVDPVDGPSLAVRAAGGVVLVQQPRTR